MPTLESLSWKEQFSYKSFLFRYKGQYFVFIRWIVREYCIQIKNINKKNYLILVFRNATDCIHLHKIDHTFIFIFMFIGLNIHD